MTKRKVTKTNGNSNNSKSNCCCCAAAAAVGSQNGQKRLQASNDAIICVRTASTAAAKHEMLIVMYIG